MKVKWILAILLGAGLAQAQDASDLTLHMVGHAHIDLAYRWRWNETLDTVIPFTFRGVLDLMDKEPGLTFAQSQMALYEATQRSYPDLFQRIQKRIREGRWAVVGGQWSEPLTMSSAGEALVRECLIGKQYAKEVLGVDVKVGWAPDAWDGQCNTLPQILKGCGLDTYVVSRGSIPGKPVYWWEGPDGSRILVYNVPRAYDFSASPSALAKLGAALKDWSNETGGTKGAMQLYGRGDHGGGPRAQDVEGLQALERTTGAPRFVYDTPQHYFDTVIMPVSEKLPVVKECIRPVEAEYMAPDGRSWCISYASPASLRGPYRQALNLLLSAEKFDTFGTYCQRKPFYPRVDFREAWKRLLELNDHNMLTANSRVYEDLDEKLKFIFREGEVLLNQGLEYIGARVDTTGPGIPVMVYNPVSWPRSGIVEATVRFMEPVEDFDIRDLQGKPLLFQKLGSDEQKQEWRILVLLRDVPSLGYTLIRATPGMPYTPSSPLRASVGMLENEYLKVTLDRAGTVTSLYDEISKRETLAGPANLLGLFKEDLGMSDSYALQLTSQKARFEPMGAPSLVESGPVRAVVRSRFRSEDSQFTVDTMLEAGSPRVEFTLTADWHDRDKALLADFPVRVDQGKATFEKPYGFEETSPDGQRQCAQQWIDLSTDTFGVSLLNTGLYEFYAEKNVLRAALLRGTRDMNARMDEGTQSFHYALYPHVRGWKDADTVRQAAELNAPMVSKQEPHHAGTLTGWGSASNPAYPPEQSFLSLTPKNVVVTAIKMSEDPWGPNELVVRLQETAGRPAEGELSLAFTVASGEETNLIEEPTGNKLKTDGGRVHFNIRPRQIKTLKLELRAKGW